MGQPTPNQSEHARIFDYMADYTEKGLTFYLNRNYVYCQYYAQEGATTEDRRLQMSAGLKVDSAKYSRGEITKDQAAHMRRLQGLIDVYEADMRQAGRLTNKGQVEAIILEAIGKAPNVRGTKNSFIDLYSTMIVEVEAGRVLNKGKLFSQSWVRIAQAAKEAIKGLPQAQKHPSKLTVEDMSAIDAHLSSMLVMGDKKASKNTVAAYIGAITAILNKMRRMGWYEGARLDTQNMLTTPEDIDHGQYLNSDELAKIAALDTDPMHRDAFILGCWLGFRYSDLCRVTPAHRRGDVVNINTKKTGSPVWVPLSPEARQIWERHNGRFVIGSRKVFHSVIKKMGEDAGISHLVLFSRTEGGEKVERWVKKSELLGTHTMRRSFATNAYKAGVPMPSIMKVTGHKTTASFLKYIRLSDEEHATLLSQHDFFK